MNTRNPLNIGAAARGMSNFGFTDLRLVRPYDPSFREARSAVGASPVLAAAREYANVAEAVADCSLVIGTTSGHGRELQHELKLLSEASKIISRQSRRGRVALLFGSEKRGLSNEDFSHCHWLLRIPTREDHESMNLGQAVAVCLYELAQGTAAKPGATVKSALRRETAQKGTTPADQASLERLISLLMESLRVSGYLEREPTASSREKVCRLVLRLGLSAADAEVWQGMMRQIVWKLNRQR